MVVRIENEPISDGIKGLFKYGILIVYKFRFITIAYDENYDSYISIT